jgi:DNA-binding response OmpR family regulator
MKAYTKAVCFECGGRVVGKSISVGGYTLRDDMVFTDGTHECLLTPTLYRIAEVLIKNHNVTIPRHRIESYLYSSDREFDTRVVDVYIGYLRKRIGKHLIKTVTGIGYKFVTNERR